MSLTKLLLLSLIILPQTWAGPNRVWPANKIKKEFKQNPRAAIGPVMNPPILYKNKIYTLATTGVLYESNPDFSKLKAIATTLNTTASGLLLHEGVLYYGEGIHHNKVTYLHAYDLNLKKEKFKIEFKGHIERAPVAQGNTLFVGLGPGGLAAVDLNKQKVAWKIEKLDGKSLHVDMTPVLVKNNLCFTSVYDYRALICMNTGNQKVLVNHKFKWSPKGQIGYQDGVIYGMLTEANFIKDNWKSPGIFFGYGLKDSKIQFETKLRGFNMFAPYVENNEAFVSLSTGDFITISLKDGAITYVDEFPEPLVSSTFKMKNSYCAIGIMGKLLCYKRRDQKNNSVTPFTLSYEKRFMETVVGQVSGLIGDDLYLPTRVGHQIVSLNSSL